MTRHKKHERPGGLPPSLSCFGSNVIAKPIDKRHKYVVVKDVPPCFRSYFMRLGAHDLWRPHALSN